jgi:hypothetical protein
LRFLTTPEFQASILAGNAGTGEIPLRPLRQRWGNNEHFFLSLWEQGKSSDNKLDW